jgi:hypothetical protein
VVIVKKTMLLALLILTAALPGSANSQQKVALRPHLNGSESMKQWELDGSGSWRCSGGNLILFKAGVPSGPIRRPAALALFKSKPFRQVTIEAEIRSTAPLDVVRRDLDVVVAYESPTRFYYIHLAGIADNVHNGIFLVNNSDRVRIDSGNEKPQLTDFAWHHVRVTRDGLSGHIAVYVDKFKDPVLEAVDTTICCGKVGLGSFDDTGEFRRILVSGYPK